MKLSWDENKRQKVLKERGLDMADVLEIFENAHFTAEDNRTDYGEVRHVTTGFLNSRLCVVVWTLRDPVHHIISLRKANDREKARFKNRVD
jgi:uncharacterized protein